MADTPTKEPDDLFCWQKLGKKLRAVDKWIAGGVFVLLVVLIFTVDLGIVPNASSNSAALKSGAEGPGALEILVDSPVLIGFARLAGIALAALVIFSATLLLLRGKTINKFGGVEIGGRVREEWAEMQELLDEKDALIAKAEKAGDKLGESYEAEIERVMELEEELKSEKKKSAKLAKKSAYLKGKIAGIDLTVTDSKGIDEKRTTGEGACHSQGDGGNSEKHD